MSASDWLGQARPAGRAETAADLRAMIEQAELIVGNLRGAGERAATLLYLLDAIHELVGRLSGTGIDLRAEAARIETVEGLLGAKDTVLLAEVRRFGGLPAAREALKPPPGRWWWYLDRRLAARRVRRLRRVLLVAGGVAATLLVAALLYRLAFPPDPRRMAAMDAQTRAEQLLDAGDLAGALASYRQAAELMPEDAELQIWVGVLQAAQGQDEAAAAAFGSAEELMGDRAQYLVGRGMAWQRIGELERAEADGQAALAIEPDSAEAYLLLGGVYEARGDTPQAIEAFQRAGDLAEQAGNSALTVMARTRLAMLLQAVPALPLEGETPAGSP